jgi:hypothetical protein
VIRPGQPWGEPTSSPPDREVDGDDADLAATVADAPGVLVRLCRPDRSDLARSVGLEAGGAARGIALPMDALAWGAVTVVNMLVLGTPPDRLRRWSRRTPVAVTVDGTEWFAGRATTVVVAIGQFRRGLEVVPGGHPGDGRAEIQVYAVHPRERPALRARLRTGSHVPHPGIARRTGRRVEVRFDRGMRVEADGDVGGGVRHVVAEVVPAAYRLLV